ncbi:hypothetical protein F9C07_1996 [Aspergillus flavus]|uniref:Uncharacterized protein n=1 Tax=Aspergillus flavus (strain ATCC 200026 / FGSC A1120 / IAM 13836 / NRRL 3357 / JCM 12722 / SRRC 167) TaxID=332952 RepID=A0A7U2MG22_ASPFN|nr:hypothetical protein F9C07_1996 [Aspergillus flavus]
MNKNHGLRQMNSTGKSIVVAKLPYYHWNLPSPFPNQYVATDVTPQKRNMFRGRIMLRVLAL